MMNPQILSAIEPRAPASPAAPVFDACDLGVALRAVLGVEAVIAAALMYVASAPADWLARLAFATSGALPATLLWLLACCRLKPGLARLAWPAQMLAGLTLGALAGLLACAATAWLGAAGRAPWLAAACSGALLAAALMTAWRWRARGRGPAATTARLAELQSRIRPHFLFNTLNTAIALVREEPAKAEAVLEDLAELFRHALAERADSASLEQEIELARRYLEIAQARFGERLRVEWSLDARANAARLPPLILQPLVENAVKHGVEPSAGGALLRVRTRRRGQTALIQISNTLPAGQGAVGHGIALDNVRDRLRLLHDLHGSFRAGRVGDSYQVRIEVPLPREGRP